MNKICWLINWSYRIWSFKFNLNESINERFLRCTLQYVMSMPWEIQSFVIGKTCHMVVNMYIIFFLFCKAGMDTQILSFTKFNTGKIFVYRVVRKHFPIIVSSILGERCKAQHIVDSRDTKIIIISRGLFHLSLSQQSVIASAITITSQRRERSSY